jgi:DNA-binding IclR family transcriptional regulator
MPHRGRLVKGFFADGVRNYEQFLTGRSKRSLNRSQIVLYSEQAWSCDSNRRRSRSSALFRKSLASTAKIVQNAERAHLENLWSPMEEATGTSNSVDRALSILELVVHEADGMTNSEISRQLSIPKSSASYILRTLEQRGYLRRDSESQRYRIGLKVAGLTHGMREFADLRQAASAVLDQLVERTRLTAHLAILEHGRAVYIDRAERPGFLRINTWVGRELDVHTTAVGKVLLAYRPQGEVRRILAAQGMEAKTPKTISNPDDYLEELVKVRTEGFAEDDEENNLGVRCVAAPVFGGSGEVVAAIGLTGASSQVTTEDVPQLSRIVIKGALMASRNLGYTGAR